MIERPKLSKAEVKVESGGNYFGSQTKEISFIPSGAKLLDLALGGGWAEQRICNIIGSESAGKTLLAIEACANFARKYTDSPIFYRETEHAFINEYAAALGMPLDRVDFGSTEPVDTVESWYEDVSAALKNCNKSTPGFYVLDSLDALSDAAEIDRGFGEGSYGTQKAKNLSKLFRMLTGEMSRHNFTLMIVSQVRTNLNATFGDKTTVSGGRALGFYASQRVMLNQTGQVYRTVSGIKRTVGVDVVAKVKKNKVGLPFRDAAFTISFGYGVDDVESCLHWLKEAKALPEGIAYTDKAIGEYIRAMNKMDDKAYWTDVKDIYRMVEDKWWSIERSLLPTRQKYER